LWDEATLFETTKGNLDGPSLHAYLLGLVDFEAALRLQRQLVYYASDETAQAALILCEHPPVITVGRQGSHAHILYEPEELDTRHWPVRWVNRGGGCLLHLPGQLAIYPIFPLQKLGLGLRDYLDQLHRVVIATLADFSVTGERRPDRAGVWVGNRMVAGIGVAVRDWVSWYGAVLNVAPDLVPFRQVRNGDPEDGPMTSLARERRGPVRMAFVRQSLVEHITHEFGFGRTSVFFSHPSLDRQAHQRVRVGDRD
jgi:lipoyl(octanoyl) transferase